MRARMCAMDHFLAKVTENITFVRMSFLVEVCLKYRKDILRFSSACRPDKKNCADAFRNLGYPKKRNGYPIGTSIGKKRMSSLRFKAKIPPFRPRFPHLAVAARYQERRYHHPVTLLCAHSPQRLPAMHRLSTANTAA